MAFPSATIYLLRPSTLYGKMSNLFFQSHRGKQLFLLDFKINTFTNDKPIQLEWSINIFLRINLHITIQIQIKCWFSWIIKSSPESDWRFPWEFQCFNANQCPVLIHWVVDVRQVLQCWTLTHSPELVVYWTVADANVSVVVAQIRNWNAAQMGANSWTHQDCSLAGRCQDDFWALVENSLDWVLVLLFDLFGGESSDEDWSAVPDDLDDFGWRKFWNVDFHVSVSVVPGPSGHSADCRNGIKSCEVQHTSVVNSTECVKLSSSDLSLVFVVYSVFIEPVIDSGLEIDMVAEVTGAGRGDKEIGLVRHWMEAVQLFVCAFVIFADQTEIGFEFLNIRRERYVEWDERLKRGVGWSLCLLKVCLINIYKVSEYFFEGCLFDWGNLIVFGFGDQML